MRIVHQSLAATKREFPKLPATCARLLTASLLLLAATSATAEVPLDRRTTWSGALDFFVTGAPLALDSDGDLRIDAPDQPAVLAVPGTWLQWSGSRAPAEREHFQLHVAEAGPSGSWSMVLDEGSGALFEFRPDAVDSSPATFHSLRVADDCEQESPLP